VKKAPSCTLCSNDTQFFAQIQDRLYFKCTHCHSVILHPDNYLDSQQEKARYLEHNNDVNDPGYQQFVFPLVNAVIQHHKADEKGLDYGSGTGPVITKLLTDKGYQVATYDPFFNPEKSMLSQQYDYIICCEVIEHFQKPVEEFNGLRKILKPGGILYCMTYLFSEEINFKTWNYKDDKTHVIIYHPQAIKLITEKFGFKDYSINKRLITFYG